MLNFMYPLLQTFIFHNTKMAQAAAAAKIRKLGLLNLLLETLQSSSSEEEEAVESDTTQESESSSNRDDDEVEQSPRLQPARRAKRRKSFWMKDWYRTRDRSGWYRVLLHELQDGQPSVIA